MWEFGMFSNTGFTPLAIGTANSLEQSYLQMQHISEIWLAYPDDPPPDLPEDNTLGFAAIRKQQNQ